MVRRVLTTHAWSVVWAGGGLVAFPAIECLILSVPLPMTLSVLFFSLTALMWLMCVCAVVEMFVCEPLHVHFWLA